MDGRTDGMMDEGKRADFVPYEQNQHPLPHSLLTVIFETTTTTTKRIKKNNTTTTTTPRSDVYLIYVLIFRYK